MQVTPAHTAHPKWPDSGSCSFPELFQMAHSSWCCHKQTKGRGNPGGIFSRSPEFTSHRTRASACLPCQSSPSQPTKEERTEPPRANLKGNCTASLVSLGSLREGQWRCCSETPAQDQIEHQERESKTTNALDSVQNQSSIGIYPREMLFTPKPACECSLQLYL